MKDKNTESKQKDRTKMKGYDKEIDKLKQKLESIQSTFSSEEDVELDIPSVPEPPKRKEKLTKASPDLNPDVLKRMKKVESPNMKVVLVNCDRCNAVIPIPVPKKVILESVLPIVPISYVHKNLEKKDQHCITIHLDHDFDIRRQRLSDVVLSLD